MALVFISHAHGDEELVRKIVNLLRDALKLEPGDFFVSSQGGRGVAPAAKIRDEILKTLKEAPALVVVVTPKSAGSPWVWLEAGNRLGCEDRSNPLFLVPSQRFVDLLKPVADLRSICLDNDDDLHELIKAVGAAVGRQQRDVLEYNDALGEVRGAATTAYSPFVERKTRTLMWLRTNAAALLIAVVAPVVAWFLSTAKVQNAARAAANEAQQRIAELETALNGANDVVNDEVSRTAARFLVLKGVVLSDDQPVANARVTASLNADPGAECVEPVCTHSLTTTDGGFRLDLTKIRAQNGDDILLKVAAEGFDPVSKLVKLDVRAMDSASPAQTVGLKPARNPIGPQS
jgi:hypothetical protein